MLETLKSVINQAVNDLYGKQVEVEIEHPEERFGDYSTNVSLKLSKELNKSPKDIADELVTKLSGNDMFSEVSVAGPGFINFSLSNGSLVDLAESEPSKSLEGKVVVAEYGDPNPFKILHAGHLYTAVVGDSIANLLQSGGANVHRVNFGGDVGRHVAMNIWAIIKELGGEYPEKLQDIDKNKRSEWLSQCYVKGNDAYETDEQAKAEIQELNKRIYEVSLNHDKDSPLGSIYWTCRSWSYQYFEDFYARLNIKFERYYPESEVSELGLKTVKEHTPGVYEESQGAIIFNGEKYGLYTNVFINSQGLPTYAAKDVGLIMQKWQDYHFDQSIYITASEIDDYIKVVLKSVEQFEPNLVKASRHLTHGLVKLAGGQKMSSRKGNILKATDILDLADQAIKAKGLNADSKITVGAVKYTFLKQGMGGDIIYDPEESISIEGNSGPYLQYAYARAMSIIDKAGESDFDLKSSESFTDFERSLLRKIAEYSEVVELATAELKPHHVATYLYDLAQVFNRFYENSRVVGDERQNLRLALVRLYGSRLQSGLKLLGIETLNKM